MNSTETLKAALASANREFKAAVVVCLLALCALCAVLFYTSYKQKVWEKEKSDLEQEILRFYAENQTLKEVCK